MHENFIVREPLLDPKQRVLGYELTWQQKPGQRRPANEDLMALAEFAAEQLNDDERGWLLGDKILFLEACPAMLDPELLQAFPPKSTILTLTAAQLSEPAALTAAQAIRAKGYGISLRNADLKTAARALLPSVSHTEVVFSGTDFMTQARNYAALKQSSVRMVGRPVTTWPDYDACAMLGLDAFVGKLHLTPRPGSESKGLNPAQTVILQLMEMVRQNADVPQIEAMLKRDAALSYKLLRYINSAGVGMGREIQSLRQAISMLGYAPLYRWLSLLLATASTSGYSPVLMETAVIRGRLTELLAKANLPKGEAENLFVTGMFSLLDRLLGISMAEVLEKIVLPDPVREALLNRTGVYGPYLALAEACELDSPLVGALAATVKLSAEDVNKAHLSALAWSQNIGL